MVAFSQLYFPFLSIRFSKRGQENHLLRLLSSWPYPPRPPLRVLGWALHCTCRFARCCLLGSGPREHERETTSLEGADGKLPAASSWESGRQGFFGHLRAPVPSVAAIASCLLVSQHVQNPLQTPAPVAPGSEAWAPVPQGPSSQLRAVSILSSGASPP